MPSFKDVENLKRKEKQLMERLETVTHPFDLQINSFEKKIVALKTQRDLAMNQIYDQLHLTRCEINKTFEEITQERVRIETENYLERKLSYD